jgi:hypothetical protein
MTGPTVKLSLCIAAVLLCPAIASTQTMTDMASKTSAAPQTSPGRTRIYYIAADDVTLDYVPGGVDVITGQPFKSFGSFQVAGKRIDRPVPTAYVKTLYREYTDAKFKTRKARPTKTEPPAPTKPTTASLPVAPTNTRGRSRSALAPRREMSIPCCGYITSCR